MRKDNSTNLKPLVTVMLPTYNRAQTLRTAIESVLGQSYSELELFVVRDGGEPVASVVECYGDKRIHFIDRSENRGKAASLNEALALAKGRYVCYLDDDDLWYPNHIQRLVETLEHNPEYGVAYSDLYKVHYRPMSGNRRQILAKNLEVSRDYDRMVMLQFNHVLHVSLMHRRELLNQAGPYNEKLNVLIDWDLTRRLSFFADFLHVPVVTGEYYASVGESDRISVQRRENVNEYLRNLLTIRTTRPPKPWPCIDDLSVIVLSDRWNEQLTKTLGDIWSHSFYPKQTYIPLPEAELSKIQTAAPNIVKVPVAENATPERKVDAALSVCEGDYIAIVPVGLPVENDEVSLIERSLYPLIQNKASDTVYELAEATAECWGAVFRKTQLLRLRREYPNHSVRQAATESRMEVKKPEYADYPFQFDNLLTAAGQVQREGDWMRAAGIYEYMRTRYGNTLWMDTLRANALYQCGHIQQAARIAHELNDARPTVARLVMEARAYMKMENWTDAARLYRKAESRLDGQVFNDADDLQETLEWTH